MRVYDSQAYRKIDVTRECFSPILELREILLYVKQRKGELRKMSMALWQIHVLFTGYAGIKCPPPPL